MTDALVLGLVATVLSGVAGHTVNATVLVYSASAQTLTVNGQEVHVPAGQTIPVSVRLPVAAGTRTERIAIQSDATRYELAVRVIGRRNLSWLWGLTAVPVAAALFAVRVTKIRADSS